MATPDQLTSPTWAVAAFRALGETWARIQTAHRINNGTLIALNAKADGILDPEARARVKARIAASVRRQELVTAAMRGLVGTINGLRDGLASALRAVGLPTTGLAGLGVVPLVPVAIGLGIVAAAGVAASILAATTIQGRAIENDAQLIAALRAGQLTPEQTDALMRRNHEKADKDTSALGLDSIFKSALPLVLAVGAVLLAPKVFDLIGRRRVAA